jgi:hypothetical protein
VYDGVAATVRAHDGRPSTQQLTAALDQQLRERTGWSLDQFVQRWRADILAELGSSDAGVVPSSAPGRAS